MSETIDYNVVLADLEAKRAAIDTAIAAMRQMLNIGADQPSNVAAAQSSERRDQLTEIRFDSFFGLSIPDAIKKCFAIIKRPLGLMEITKLLDDGGLLSSSKDLSSTVSATLTRMKNADGDIVQVQGKWAPVEWYPAMRKEKVEAHSKTKTKTRKKPAAKSGDAATRKVGETKLTSEKVQQIRARRDEGRSQYEIAKEFGVSRSAIQHILRGDTAASRVDAAAPNLRVVEPREAKETA
jgi:DNA-binding XRE family transcriptional regulator